MFFTWLADWSHLMIHWLLILKRFLLAYIASDGCFGWLKCCRSFVTSKLQKVPFLVVVFHCQLCLLQDFCNLFVVTKYNLYFLFKKCLQSLHLQISANTNLVCHCNHYIITTATVLQLMTGTKWAYKISHERWWLTTAKTRNSKLPLLLS